MALPLSRARADPSFVVHHWNTRHNVLADCPDLVASHLAHIPSSLAKGN